MSDSFIPVEAPEETVSSFIPATTEDVNFQPEYYKRQQATMAAAVNGNTGDYKKDYIEKFDLIESRKEELERSKAANNRINRLSTSLQDRVNQGDVDDDLLRSSVALIVAERQRDQRYALEQEFIEKYKNFESEEPAWAEMRMLNKDFVTQRDENNLKDLMIRNALHRRAFQLEEEDSFVGDVVDVVTDAASLGIQNFVSFLRAGDWNGAGAELRRKGHDIRQLPVEEIPAAIDEFAEYLTAGSALLKSDDERVQRQLENALGTGAIEGITAEEVLLSMVDAIFIPAGKAVKNTDTVAEFLTKHGGREQVAQDASSLLRGEQLTTSSTVESIEEAVEQMIPVRVDTDGSVDGLSASIRADLEANQRALEELKTLSMPERLAAEEVAEGVRKSISKFKKLHKRNEITHTEVSYDPNKGVYSFDILQGRKDGSPYASQASAAGARNKAKVGGEVFQSSEGGWYIKHKQVVTETMLDKGFQSMSPVNTVKRWLQAPKAFVDTFTGELGTAAASSEARITGVVKSIYNKNIRKLPSKQFNKVFQIADEGMSEINKATGREGVWYSSKELSDKYLARHGEPINEAQVKAYMAARQISDFAYFLENQAAYKQAVAKGLQTINLPGKIQESFNGKVITEPKAMTEALGKRIYNMADETFETFDQRAYEIAQKRGLQLVRPEDSGWTVDLLGEGASYILVRPSNLKVSELNYNQIGYLAGGRVRYDDKFFVGQVRKGKFSDGTRYQMRPKTHRSAKTQLEAEKYRDMHNKGMELVKEWKEFGGRKGRNKRKKLGIKGKTHKEMSAEVMAVTGKSLDDYMKFLETEGFDIHTPLHWRRDREAPRPDDETLEAMEEVMMYDPESLSTGFGVNKMGRLSARTDERLKNVNEDDAVRLDFITSLNQSMDQAISAGSHTDFKISAVNRFNTTFRKYFENADRYTPYQIATGDAKVRSDIVPETINQIKAHQAYINSVLRQPSEWDAAVQNTVNKFAHFVERKTDDTKLAGAGKYVSTKISDFGDPIGRIRGINFDMTLGAFNPAQLFMQANSVLTGLSLSPKHGMAAFTDIPAMRYALIAGDIPTAEHLAKATKYPELHNNVEQFKRLGFNDFGSNLAMMDAQSTIGATTNRLMSNVQRTREAGRFFFQEGERYGRLMAYNIARRKYAELDHKTMKLDSDLYGRDADNWIREETDRLLLSPNSDNNQLFTKGFTALPTQFWSYMGKMADAVLTGSGKRADGVTGRYTREERARLIAGQALFYGAAGVPLMDWALDKYNKETGNVMDGAAAKFIHNGLIDTMMYVATDGEMDTNFSESSGLGGFMSQMKDNLFENPLSEVAFGAVGSKVKGSIGLMAETAQMYSLWHNPTVEGVTATTIAGMNGLFSGMDKVTRGILAYNTGIWFSKHGDKIGDVSSAEAIASIFGIKPQVESDVYSIFADRKEAREKYIRDVSKALDHLHAKWERARTPNEKKHIEDLINTFANIHGQSGYFPEVTNQVIKNKRQRTYEEGAKNKLMEDYFQNKGGNFNYLPEEFKQQIIEEKNNDN